MTEVYAGLDISDKSTHVWVVDSSGGVIWSGACATDPETIARTLKSHAAGLVRVILETGPLSAFLYHGLVERAKLRWQDINCQIPTKADGACPLHHPRSGGPPAASRGR